MNNLAWLKANFFIFLKILSCFIVFLGLSRLTLAFINFEHVNTFDNLLTLMFNGLRGDLALFGWVISPLFIFWLLLPISKSRTITLTLFTIITLIIVVIESCTQPFINAYGVRPNRLFVEYLIYPKEVGGMLLKGFFIEILITSVISIISFFILIKLIYKIFPKKDFPKANFFTKIIYLTAFIALSVLMARGTLTHRPLNPSTLFVSEEALLNSLAVNSPYNVGFELRSMIRENDILIYDDFNKENTLKVLAREIGLPSYDIEAKNPTMHYLISPYEGRKYNVVIILEESLGAQFTGTLANTNLTPNLDKLYEEGWGFYNIYATGTRSIRGIEATTTGFTPSSNVAAPKLSKAQHNFFNIASVFANNGYNTSFIYGGESHFDNMRSFFLGNNYQTIIEEKDYVNPKSVSVWGVSDEDLFNKAHEYFTEQQNLNKPFYSLVFSSSNHDPFDVPNDHIIANNNQSVAPIGSRENAINYADYALGTFIEKAKKSNYWDNTIFIVIADHDARASGKTLVPVNNFKIPAVIFGKDIKPQKDERLVSQIDITPTLISLAGLSSRVPCLGRDLNDPKALQGKKGRAIFQYYNNFGLLTGSNKLVVLQPETDPITYIYDPKTNTQEQTNNKKYTINRALAWAAFAAHAYNNDWYTVENEELMIK